MATITKGANLFNTLGCDSLILNSKLLYVAAICHYHYFSYIKAEFSTQNFEFSIPVCVGGFGINCSQSCPQGYYGRRCMETCSCNITMCDNALGCPEAASGRWLYELDVGLNATINLQFL